MSAFLDQVLQVVTSLGGLGWVAKVAGAITMLISSMKISWLDDLVWKKLGNGQAWVAPLLGLIGGVAAMAGQGQLTWPGIVAYVGAGSGALLLHELLDSVKALPGLGPIWVEVIAYIESRLGGNPN